MHRLKTLFIFTKTLNYFKMKTDLFTQENLQQFFETDFNELAQADHNEVDHIEQSHFGDLLVEKHEDGSERLKLWANYDGEEITGIEVEYCGKLNNYTWQTVFEL